MSINDTTKPASSWFTNNRRTIIRVAVVATPILLVAIIVLMIWNYTIQVSNEGERMQERIETTYKSSQNSLSACIDQGDVAAQVTQEEYKALGDILTNVASARYTDAAGNPTNASGVLGGGALISALREDYPQIDQRSWQNLQALVIGCRDDFQGAQDRVFFEANLFEEWQTTNNILNTGIKAGFPSEELDVLNIATGQTVRGQAALDYMTRVISVEEANNAFETGTLQEQDLFGDS